MNNPPALARLPNSSDYVLIGGGTSGCLLAAELARLTSASVLLLESGPPADSLSSSNRSLSLQRSLRRPAEYLKLQGGPLDWNYQCAASSGLSGRQIACPRGRLLGGSSGINAMIFCPGHADDLADWESLAGPDWSPGQIEGYFQQMLDQTRGRLSIEHPHRTSPACQAFIEAANAGIAQGRFTGEALAYRRTSNRDGRQTAADAFLPAPLPSNLTVITSTAVRSIKMHAQRAVGVCVGTRDDQQIIAANRAVILCAGAIASPQLLMLSGIGPAEHLMSLGITPTVDNPHVGRNLTDHIAFPVIYALPDHLRFPTSWSASDLARWEYLQTGPIASNLAEVGGFFDLPRASEQTKAEQSASEQSASEARSRQRADTHDTSAEKRAIQLHVTPTHYLLHPQPSAPAAISIAVTRCKPTSRGSVTLRSADPDDAPVIDPGYCTDPQDVASIVGGVELVRQIAAMSPLANLVQQELLPGPRRNSADKIARAIARYAITMYHPVGTCAMSADHHQGVVDPMFAVHHTQGLHVVDASVFPTIPKANPVATTMMIAHRAARILGG